jgi:hypothetical protein
MSKFFSIKKKITARRSKKHQYFSFDVPGQIDININVKPYIDIIIEVPRNDNETDIYCVDLTHVAPNTIFTKLNLQAYYQHTRTRKKVKHDGSNDHASREL